MADAGPVNDGTSNAANAERDIGGKKIVIGQPKHYPHHVTDALSRFFAQRREVKAAYLAHVLIQEDMDGPHTLIGVDMTGDWQLLNGDAAILIREVAMPDDVVDFMQIGHDTADTVSMYLLGNTKPFYRRRFWGLF